MDEMTDALTVERVHIGELMLDPKNARKGNVKEIMASLREFGQHRPIVARRENGQIIIGNHMYKAAKALGWEYVQCVFVDDDEETAIRRGIADNATGDLATWDDQMLAELLSDVGQVPGITDAEMQRILEDTSLDDETDEPIYPIVARPGEEYDYVLIVARNSTDVAFLRTKFQLRKERSYKSSAVGLSHVVSVERLQELWGS